MNRLSGSGSKISQLRSRVALRPHQTIGHGVSALTSQQGHRSAMVCPTPRTGHQGNSHGRPLASVWLLREDKDHQETDSRNPPKPGQVRVPASITGSRISWILQENTVNGGIERKLHGVLADLDGLRQSVGVSAAGSWGVGNALHGLRQSLRLRRGDGHIRRHRGG